MRKTFDFIKNRKIYFIISAVLMLIALASTFIFGVQLDIQFKGGAIITYSYEGSVDENDVKSLAEEIIGEQVTVQVTSDFNTNKEQVVISLVDAASLSSDTQAELTAKMQSNFADNEIELVSVSNVNPTIGSEFLGKSLLAVGVAMILMIIYIAFRFRKIGGWSAGVASVIALLHDCIVAYSVFVIFGIPLDLNFIAVLLTILGYSINATIIVYDRVRENKNLYGKTWDFHKLVNTSINQSMSRSINTSIATILVMLSVCVVAIIYNLDSIYSFAFPLVIGLVAGCYSSLCISVPLWTVWQDRKTRNAVR